MILLIALLLIIVGVLGGPEFSEHAAFWLGIFPGVAIGAVLLMKLYVWLFVGSSKQ